MTAEGLRAFVLGALEELDDEPRPVLADSLMARAAKGPAGWNKCRRHYSHAAMSVACGLELPLGQTGRIDT